LHCDVLCSVNYERLVHKEALKCVNRVDAPPLVVDARGGGFVLRAGIGMTLNHSSYVNDTALFCRKWWYQFYLGCLFICTVSIPSNV